MSHRGRLLSFLVGLSILFFCIALILLALRDMGDKVETAVEDAQDHEETPTTLTASPPPTVISAPIPTGQAPGNVNVIPTSTYNVAVASNVTPVVPITTTCTLPLGWVPYTVTGGDTLAIIAAATGTTTEALASANCLTNPDAILVGQVLYIPVVLSAGNPQNPPNTTATPPLLVQPGNWNGTSYTLTPGDAVTIQLQPIPLNAVSVDFYYTDSRTLQLPALITRDEDMQDGAIITWTAPLNNSGILSAVVTLADGSEVSINPVMVAVL